MKLAVVGGRDFFDYALLKEKLDKVHSRKKITAIISGGARGADSLGAAWAIENGIRCIEFFPDWNKFGKRAGFLRNEHIISEADVCIAFWDGKSRGTKSSIDFAEKKGIPLHIVSYT